MRTDRLFRIAGARRRKPAGSLQARHDFQRSKDHAIGADEEDENRLHEPPSMARFPKKATRYRSILFQESGLGMEWIALALFNCHCICLKVIYAIPAFARNQALPTMLCPVF